MGVNVAAMLNKHITMRDAEGNEQEFDFFDLIETSDRQFVVLLPVDEASMEVFFLEVLTDVEDSDHVTYAAVTDPELLDSLFSLFRTKFKNILNFQ